MSVEVLPVGTRCSLACKMCYQTNIRDAGNQSDGRYDVDAMKAGLEKEGHAFTVFGGEPLLTDIDDLEELWRWGFERYGRNSIQTSATLVTERHMELFRRYNVAVGISLEGPGELNDIRWAGSLERTRDATERAEGVLGALLEAGRPVSLITTLNRANASRERLPRLLDWYRELDGLGLKSVNLHLMESETDRVRTEWGLSEDENVAALLGCADLQPELATIRFQPLTDMMYLLRGADQWDGGGVSCIWSACDPYTTRAVRGINGRGERINCSRTNKAGVDLEKADRELLVRPLALYQTPQAHGGCAGCRFWFACKGECPGAAERGDWRLRTEHCGVLKRVFAELERRLSSLGFRPVSADDRTRRTVEERMLRAFQEGRVLSVRQALAPGDAYPSKGIPPKVNGHGDAPHGDSPHGDLAHGDHQDASAPVVTHGDHGDQGAG